MPIEVITGRAGAGKTAMLADKILEILERNKKYYEKTKILRFVYINFPLNDFLEEKYKFFLRHWETVTELINLEDCDIFIDELLYYFDATQWKETTLQVKRFIAIHRHLGVEIYATSQDFAQVDIAFRRLTDKLFYLVKLASSREPSATKPPVKRIWGISVVYTISPVDYKEDQKENKTSFHWLFFVTRKKCEVYNTRQKYKPGEFPDLQHYERYCANRPVCTFHRTLHI
jgi:hypothetical protein